MESTRPRVSRETRLLLAIVLISLSMLWVLARIRFPARPATPNPVPPVLAQLAPPSAFEDIVASVAQLQPRVASSLVPIAVRRQTPEAAGLPAQEVVPAMRLRDDLAVTILRGTPAAGGPTADIGIDVVARDAASGLAVVRVPATQSPALTTTQAPAFTAWSPRRLEYPRFLIAAEALLGGISLRPIFIGSLFAVRSPLWPDPIWSLSDRTDVAAGTFAFTVDGELVGVVIERAGRVAIVPADLMMAAANRLITEGPRTPGHLGIEVAPLTPDLGAATGAVSGAIVTWVDPEGPAAGQLTVPDVIEEMDGQAMTALEQWHARVARLAVGDSVALKARGRNGTRDVTITAGPLSRSTGGRPLGLTMRSIRQVGAEILRIDPGSAAEHAGLRVGDIITVVADVEAPTSSQVLRSFGSAPNDRPLLVAVTRGEDHRVFAVEKTW